ncbi:MAG: 4-hydroxy-3-methylbut-2-enyl diphosphate reductase [Candidatus Omnitrophica bacterium]|nr:4-hydroxy-3-methylbut-2-enyl diphosphate reductase [Candidatus Omnitrophota bacterium]
MVVWDMTNQGTTTFNKGFGLKSFIQDELENDYRSRLIEEIRVAGNTLSVGGLRFHIAKEFGFCYGVEKAIDYAYQTRRQFPDRPIYLTAELIHNPRVNHRLRQMGIRFLNGRGDGDKPVETVTPQDVVVIAAFGAPTSQMELLQKKGCVLVDTTCGSVVHVWKRVEKYAQDGFTAVVHGNYRHEETQATISRATQFPNGRYLVIWDKGEAEKVCHFIRNGGNEQEFLSSFGVKCSKGFSPNKDLEQIGIANQTTMLASESLYIAQMLRQALADRYGEPAIASHFHSFDTICSATQDRQDAMKELLEKRLDIVLVIGGFNSSNTTHLAEMSSQKVKSYHIDDSECIISRDQIRHKPVGAQHPVISHDWLVKEPADIGLTAGASTPNQVIDDTLKKVLSCYGYSIDQIRLA